MSTIAAIPTRYAGCHFRSRLEARWAVFFDTLGIRWEYEPEGYELSNGECYLPDFWLPAIEVWLEVKGDMRIGWAKWRLFHEAINGQDFARDDGWFVGYGNVDTIDLGERIAESTYRHAPTPRTFLVGPVPSLHEAMNEYGIMYGPGSPHPGWIWCRCRACGEVDIAHVAMPSFMHCGAESGDWDDPRDPRSATYPSTGRHPHRIDALTPRIVAAYDAARSARFEHGQSGAT
jgi:hypothetical protein